MCARFGAPTCSSTRARRRSSSSSNGRLTLDHVVPRSKGGESIWENVVTACAPCNLRKGDRSLDQVGMVLKTLPRPPQPVLFIKLAAPRIPHGWTPYLGKLGT